MLTEELTRTGRIYAMPNDQGVFEESVCEVIAAAGKLDASVCVIEQPDGWRFACSAQLPESSHGYLPRVSHVPVASRVEAITAACEELVIWASECKERGSKLQRRAAEKLQEWALALEKRVATESLGVASSEAQPGAASSSVPPLDTTVQTSAIPADGELRMIPIWELHESEWNPRQYYPDGPMQELVESMKTSGYREWLPLMVRPSPTGFGYEIGAGHRRRRAAELAGIEMVPCVVRPLTDAQFLDVLNFDNAGREDVHPLHEAAGWRVWMERTGLGVLDIAARIGQSKEYVYQRLKYAALTPNAAKAFLDGEYVTAGHAILIARLDGSGQEQALQFCEPKTWEPDKRVSVRSLAAWIKKNLHASLDDADFPFDSADLVPAAGSCTACPYRLGNTADFDQTVDLPNVCTHPDCYDRKYEAHSAAERAKRMAATPAPEPWKATPAPAAEPKAKKAKPTAEEKAAQLERERLAAEEREQEAKREEDERLARIAKMDAEKNTRIKILNAILDKVKWPPKREEIVTVLTDIELPEELEEVLTARGLQTSNGEFAQVAKLSDLRLAQLLVLLDVSNDFDTWSFGHGADKLHAAARRYGVDAGKIRAGIEGGTRKEVVKQLPVLGAKKAAAKPSAGANSLKAE